MSPKRMQRKPRVFWTDEELEAVIAKAVEVALEDKEFIWSFIAKGQQQALPKERQRFIAGRNVINDKITKMFCESRQKVLEAGVPYPVFIQDDPKEVLVERPRAELLDRITTEELIGIIAKRLATIIDLIPNLLQRGKDKGALSEQAAPISTRIVQPSNQVKRLQRVLLIGFLPDQEAHIRNKANSFNLELMFQRKDASKVDPPPSCKWCILLLTKISHSTGNKVRDALGRERAFYVNGIDQAVKTLADINSRVESESR